MGSFGSQWAHLGGSADHPMDPLGILSPHDPYNTLKNTLYPWIQVYSPLNGPNSQHKDPWTQHDIFPSMENAHKAYTIMIGITSRSYLQKMNSFGHKRHLAESLKWPNEPKLGQQDLHLPRMLHTKYGGQRPQLTFGRMSRWGQRPPTAPLTSGPPSRRPRGPTWQKRDSAECGLGPQGAPTSPPTPCMPPCIKWISPVDLSRF